MISPIAPAASQLTVPAPHAAQRIGLQLQQTALTVSAMPRKSQCQNATELRNAQLSVVSCKPLLGGSWVLNTRAQARAAIRANPIATLKIPMIASTP